MHTGSRHFGKMICDYYSNIAKNEHYEKRNLFKQQEIENAKQQYDSNKLAEAIDNIRKKYPNCPKELAWLEGDSAKSYLNDMKLAQEYASLNRKCIIDKICSLLKLNIVDKIESVHNYIDYTDSIIRKGAIRAYKDERMIIPFNMRDGILICKGKSNPEWNYSAPHGAGRVLSRSKAKESILLEDYKKSMSGIYSSCVNEHTVDESPMAYKDSKMIETAIQDTAEIINRIKPILNIKAGKE